MKKLKPVALVGLLLLFVIGVGVVAQPRTPVKPKLSFSPVDQANLSKGMNTFAANLYKRLAESVPAEGRTPSNMCFSPYSISSALTMMGSGAQERTREEMSQTLQLSLDRTQTHVAFGQLQKELTASKNATVSLANGVFVEKSYPLEKDFTQRLQNNYQAVMEPADFKESAEKERLRINAWVAQKTREKIQNLLNPNQVNDQTRMILVNAIYFKADWLMPFKAEMTHEADFQVEPSVSKKVKMMFTEGDFKNYSDDKLQIWEMPYKGDEFSMMIILPTKKGGWGALEPMLTPENFSSWWSKLVYEEEAAEQVKVYLPKFKIAQRLEFAPYLQAMGIKEAFDAQKANFHGVSSRATNPLFIGEVVHQAVIEVDEKGTEAAAATAIIGPAGARMDPRPVKIFRADHPFFYILRHNPTGTILFMGRVIDPTQV